MKDKIKCIVRLCIKIFVSAFNMQTLKRIPILGTMLVKTLIINLLIKNWIVTSTIAGHSHNGPDNSNAFIPFMEPFSFGILHSMKNLTTWAVIEQVLASTLLTRLKMIREEIKLIESFLQDYKESTGEALGNLYRAGQAMKEKGKVVGSSYLLAHRMTSRFCDITKRLRKYLKSSEYIQNIHSLKAIFGLHKSNSPDELPLMFPIEEGLTSTAIILPHEWPDWPDLYMSFNSFLTLQELIPPKTLFKGLAMDTSLGGELTILQCVEMGIYALYRGVYTSAMEWLEIAMERLITEHTEDQIIIEAISLDMLSSLLKLAVQEHNRKTTAIKESSGELGYLDLDLYTEPLIREQILTNEQRPTNRRDAYLEFRGLTGKTWAMAQHMDICLGFRRQTPEMQISLKCYYEKSHPYLYINPIKVERLSETPPVLQFYEMIGNETIQRIQKVSSPSLKLSGVIGVNSTQYEKITEYRTSVGAAIGQEDFPEVYKLAEIVSGLKIIGVSEPTQIVEYSYGRHCKYHTDAYGNEAEVKGHVDKFGDRLATMLYYLEMPALGGLTSFCQAGLGAYPERGSAILWFNQYRNGTVRKDVIHGCCPVIHGHKIVANHWVRYIGNWNKYKCTLDKLQ